jgi:hypothetical protein
LLTAIVSTAVVGALYRIGIEGQHGGDPAFQAHAAGLQWGALEWRVLGANILVGLIVGGVFLVIFIIWLIAFAVTAAGASAPDLQALGGSDQAATGQALLRLMLGPGGIVSAVILIPGFCVLVYLSARLALLALLFADTGAFDFGRAWTMTKGAAPAIIVCWIVIYGAVFLIAASFGLVGGVFAAVASPGATGGGVWALVIGQSAGAAISAPMLAGLQLYVYNTRRGGDVSIAATFA